MTAGRILLALAAGVAEWWRALGLPVFAGLFALLAVQPQRGLPSRYC